MTEAAAVDPIDPVPADPARAGVLADLAGLGPFFALDSHPAGSSAVAPWRPLNELFHQPAALQARVAAVRGALAEASGQSVDAVELRVATSMAQLGLAARLICPALGVAVLTGALLEVDPARMRWQPNTEGVLALSVDSDVLASVTGSSRDPGRPSDPARLADALAARVLAGPVRALVEASGALGVSEQVLWGNVASVVHGAVALIDTAAPGLTRRAADIASGMLNQPPLQHRHQGSAYQASGRPASGQGAFRRRSCCLVYRLAPPPAPVCGDCVLNRAPAPAKQHRAGREDAVSGLEPEVWSG